MQHDATHRNKVTSTAICTITGPNLCKVECRWDRGGGSLCTLETESDDLRRTSPRDSAATYPGDVWKNFFQRVAVEVGLLVGVLHVDDVKELERLDNRVTATHTDRTILRRALIPCQFL
jgi:hypothetical protein